MSVKDINWESLHCWKCGRNETHFKHEVEHIATMEWYNSKEARDEGLVKFPHGGDYFLVEEAIVIKCKHCGNSWREKTMQQREQSDD
jgi:DNA-directed RNA polymerase subunit M/transcription elongation factor TFIIS